jgi:hypothetical protein
MSTVAQFGGKAKRLRVQLDPALKEFLDVVVIPALVKAYLLENAVGENHLALLPNGVTHSDARDSALGEVAP